MSYRKLYNYNDFHNNGKSYNCVKNGFTGLDPNLILFPGKNYNPKIKESEIECKERLGGLLKYYYRKAA